MPHVKYIGSCDKTDSIDRLGLHWKPGQVRNVTAEAAERLLAFPDTWVREKEGVSRRSRTDKPVGLAAEAATVEEPLPVIDFHGMSKEAMIEYAERTYNERLDRRLGEDAVRHRLVGLLAAHHAAA